MSRKKRVIRQTKIAGHSLRKELTEVIVKTLLKMVRSVSEDKLYDTIEFNEFLLMMGKHQETEVNMDALMEAFK